MLCKLRELRNERGGYWDTPVTSSGLGKKAVTSGGLGKEFIEFITNRYSSFHSFRKRSNGSDNNFTTSNGTILKSSPLQSPTYSVKLKKLF